MSTRITGQTMNRRVQQERVAEARHKELLTFTQTNSRQSAENRQNTLVEMKQRQGRKTTAAAESMMEERRRTAVLQERHMNRDQEQNERLAKQLLKKKSEQERAEREIQRICEGSDVLKDLESKLKTAYMNQDRVTQLEEAALQAEQKAISEQAISNQMEADRQNAILEMQYQESMRKQHAVDGRQKLEEQMEVAHYNRMQDAAFEAVQDKTMVDKIMRRIDEENYKDEMSRRNKIEKTKEVIEAYKKQREQEVANAEQAAQDEENKILAYATAKNAREATFKAAQDQKKAEEEARFKRIEADMRAKREEEEEFARLRDMLWEEETEARLRKKEEDKKASQEQAKYDMMQANEQQKVLKRQLRDEEEAEEEMLKQIMKEKFEEDIRLDEEARQRRMRERDQYKREIEMQKEEKKVKYQREKDAEAEARRRVQEEEDFKQRVVEAARQRLLQQHAQVVSGFAPKGTMAKVSDLELLSRAQ